MAASHVIMTCAGVLYRLCVLPYVQAREGRALKHCQVSFHAPQSTAAEMVTFTWTSVAPPVAGGPRQRLNQAQGPMDAENREEMVPAPLKAGDVLGDIQEPSFISEGLRRIGRSVKRYMKNMNYAAIM